AFCVRRWLSSRVRGLTFLVFLYGPSDYHVSFWLGCPVCRELHGPSRISSTKYSVVGIAGRREVSAQCCGDRRSRFEIRLPAILQGLRRGAEPRARADTPECVSRKL